MIILRNTVTLPRLAGLIGVIALLHIVWLFGGHPTVNLRDYRPGFQGIATVGGAKLGAEKNYNTSAEAIAAGNETLGFGEIIAISLD
jgi:hypothetical protein